MLNYPQSALCCFRSVCSNAFPYFYITAPRIPADKRIFTTSHTPNCLFQEIDERFAFLPRAISHIYHIFMYFLNSCINLLCSHLQGSAFIRLLASGLGREARAYLSTSRRQTSYGGHPQKKWVAHSVYRHNSIINICAGEFIDQVFILPSSVLQFAGQPFDHTPLRMRARSGEYLTLDTSWSSFVNPWSRKVAFIVGRHKVRT